MKGVVLTGFFVLLFSHTAEATNGNHLIGLSPASVAMGGTGVANYNENMDALFKNPALLSDMTCTAGRTEAAVGATLIQLNASANSGTGSGDSQTGTRILPNIAAGYRVDDDLTISLGAFAYGGNAVDYKGNASLAQLQSENRLYRLAAGVAYQISPEVSVGISPFMTYAQLNINEDAAQTGTQSTRGLSNTVAFGLVAGVTVKPVRELVIGASFVTRQNLGYSNVLDLDLFGPNPILTVTNPTLNDLHIQTPIEFAVGAAYTYYRDFKITFDYRFINWADADIFRELNWQNQNVFAVGTEYAMDDFKFRLGYNFAVSPINNTTDEAGQQTVSISGRPILQRRISLLNLAAFPAIAQSHFTAGTAYKFTKDCSLDLAFMWAPKVTITRSGSGGQGLPGEMPNYSYSGSLSEWTISAGFKTLF